MNATKVYDCGGGASSETLGRLQVAFSGDTMEMTDISKDAAPQDTGTLDPTYAPTSPQYAGAVRYAGWGHILDNGFGGGDIAHFEVIASKELKARAATGKLWIRTSGSGGGSDQYTCKVRPAKLTVETSRKARLACSVKRSICTHDNPPGDTCLFDMFVNQTSADKATMKVTFYDHFGVHADERQVQLGSSALTRSSTKASGAWQDYALDVKLRAGITYQGTLSTPDGQSTNVQCNDLAMLDAWND